MVKFILWILLFRWGQKVIRGESGPIGPQGKQGIADPPGIEGNNGYIYFYFDNDIVLESGIKIPSSKINVTIDGTSNNRDDRYIVCAKWNNLREDIVSFKNNSK